MKLLKAILSILLPIFLIFRFWRPGHPLMELLVFFLSAFFILYLTTPRRRQTARGDSRVEFISSNTSSPGSSDDIRFSLKDHPGFEELSRDRNGAVYSDSYGALIITKYRTVSPPKETAGDSPVILLLQCLITACVGLVLFHLGEAAWSRFTLSDQLERLVTRVTDVGEHLVRRVVRLCSDLYSAVRDLFGKVKNLL